MKQPAKFTIALTKTETAGLGTAMSIVQKCQAALVAAVKEAEEIILEITTVHGAPRVRPGGKAETRPSVDGRSVMIYDPVVAEEAHAPEATPVEATPEVEAVPVASANVIPMNGVTAVGAGA